MLELPSVLSDTALFMPRWFKWLHGAVHMQVRTQTLVKNAIIQVDATPFKQWYQVHYGMELGNKGKEEAPKIDDKKVGIVLLRGFLLSIRIVADGIVCWPFCRHRTTSSAS